jgi:hypothetical protein
MTALWKWRLRESSLAVVTVAFGLFESNNVGILLAVSERAPSGDECSKTHHAMD